MADASTKVSTTTQITHIGSGTSLASGGTINPSSDVSTALSFTGNLNRYPRADAALMITATASIASTSTNVYLYRRDINIDGTSDETAPAASNKQKFMGAFQVQAATTVSTTHYSQITDVPLPGAGDCEFYIENALGVNIPAGWTLKITPKTDVGATS
jgi:hypothetical protein